MNDKLDLIYDLVKELDKKQDQQCEKLVKLESHVSQNTRDLSEHIEGVKQTRILITQTKDELDRRIKNLEKPKDLAMLAVKAFIWLGSIGTAALVIIEVINKLK